MNFKTFLFSFLIAGSCFAITFNKQYSQKEWDDIKVRSRDEDSFLRQSMTDFDLSNESEFDSALYNLGLRNDKKTFCITKVYWDFQASIASEFTKNELCSIPALSDLIVEDFVTTSIRFYHKKDKGIQHQTYYASACNRFKYLNLLSCEFVKL